MFKRFPKLLAFTVLGALSFSGCISDGGTEIPNEVTGSLYTQGGAPAAGAEVTLYPVGYVPGTSSKAKLRVYASSSGRFTFKKVSAGTYNVLASSSGNFSFQDSLYVNGGTEVELSPDTLIQGGSLTGTVLLQPQHDPRTATVQLLGTDIYANVAIDGKFTVNNVPAGNYLLRVATILTEYVPLFHGFSLSAGQHDTLTEALEPFYAGIPVVRQLMATPDSAGNIRLRWKGASFGNAQAYLVYRDTAGAVNLSTNAFARTSDTSFVDTIYSRAPGEARLPYFDTTVRAYTYRVRIMDQSDNIGPVLGSVTAISFPPAKAFVSGLWHRVAANTAALNSPNPENFKLLVFQNKLTFIKKWSGQVFTSSDGITWQQIATIPFGTNGQIAAALTYQGKLWVIAPKWGPNMYDSLRANSLWNSPDGVSWTKVVDSLPIPKRSDCSFLEYQNKMWVIGGGVPEMAMSSGVVNINISAVHSSVDGITWTNANPGSGFLGGWLNEAATFGNKLWISGTNGSGYLTAGNGSALGAIREPYFAHSEDGSTWLQPPPSGLPSMLLPRMAHALTNHGGKLWIIGGYSKNGGTAGLLGAMENIGLSGEVWSSTDGISWQLIDAVAPFGPRARAGAVSFQNKLWVIGGLQEDTGDTPSGNPTVWYLEEP